MYKYFQYLTKKYPTPFEIIGIKENSAAYAGVIPITFCDSSSFGSTAFGGVEGIAKLFKPFALSNRDVSLPFGSFWGLRVSPTGGFLGFFIK